ncbi:MAG: hypothetical protein M3O46_09690, partial [Myxococcota bacterium]|nr:hypothetical protein [Myxococcota bacterium]
MVKSARGVGLSAVLGLMSAGAWLACSSSNAPLMPLAPDSGGVKEGGSGSSSGSSSGGGSGS